MTTKIHFSRHRPNAYGGHTTTSLCGRLRTLADGMNLTAQTREVTCSLCLRKMRIRRPTEKAVRHLKSAIVGRYIRLPGSSRASFEAERDRILKERRRS